MRAAFCAGHTDVFIKAEWVVIAPLAGTLFEEVPAFSAAAIVLCNSWPRTDAAATDPAESDNMGGFHAVHHVAELD
jgi:hypothetical protein